MERHLKNNSQFNKSKRDGICIVLSIEIERNKVSFILYRIAFGASRFPSLIDRAFVHTTPNLSSAKRSGYQGVKTFHSVGDTKIDPEWFLCDVKNLNGEFSVKLFLFKK